jgi:aldehyde dehydrogenase (NAD+)
VVLDDADLSVAVEAAVNSAFFSTGQRCTASSRVIVTEGIHDRFVAAVGERLKSVVVDDALKAGTHIGPVVDESQLKQDTDYIEIGQKEGAKLAFGGELLKRETPGFYLSPALFTEATNDMRISREEIFGPVAAVIRVKDYEEALAVANDTSFGLSSGIATTSLKHATHFKRNAEAGMVMVNLPTAGVDFHVPFGGRKGSSHGPRETKAARRPMPDGPFKDWKDEEESRMAAQAEIAGMVRWHQPRCDLPPRLDEEPGLSARPVRRSPCHRHPQHLVGHDAV